MDSFVCTECGKRFETLEQIVNKHNFRPSRHGAGVCAVCGDFRNSPAHY